MATARKTTTSRTTTASKLPEREVILFQESGDALAVTIPEGCSATQESEYNRYDDEQSVFVVKDGQNVLGKFYNVTRYYDSRLNVRKIDPSLYSFMKDESHDDEDDDF